MESFTIPTHVDIELSKVKQDSKRFELLAILDDPEACHADRLDLARFLLGIAGYDVEAVLEIIHCLNHWSDYSTNMTFAQVMSVNKWIHRDNKEISNKVLSLPSFLSSLKKESVDTDDSKKKEYNSKLCIVGPTKITCYFRNCDLCSFKDLRGEK